MKHNMKRSDIIKMVIAIAAALLLIAALAVCLFFLLSGQRIGGVPTLAVETPPKQSAADRGEFTVDVTVSDLGDALYPAASLSVEFDPSRLEFLGIDEGNVFVTDSADGTKNGKKLPEWNVNAEACNKSGVINVMYLDMTGGRYAFSRDLLGRGDHTVLRLKFRLRGSARAGEVYELNIKDAVFAASDETESLASSNGTLKTQNGRVAVGK